MASHCSFRLDNFGTKPGSSIVASTKKYDAKQKMSTYKNVVRGKTWYVSALLVSCGF